MAGLTAESRSQMMLEMPISRVIPRLAVPTIISMLITSIYNIADTFFVSQLGTSASGAVGVVFSAMSLIQALAFTIGMGCGANASRQLGAGNREEAARFVNTGFFSALIVGTLVGGLGLIFLKPFVRFLGATETIAPYAEDYAFWIFAATPFMMASLVLNNNLRFQGMATYAMVGMTTGGILNMVVDPLLIFGLNMGAMGAGISTALSQVVSFVILLLMCNTRSACISIRFRDFSPSVRRFWQILYNGAPSLGRQGIASISTILLNNTAAAWGDPAIAAMSIVSRFVLFINSTVVGFGQGFQPVCAFCYGAGKYSRVREAYSFCLKVATIILVVLAGISLLFAGPIVALFRDDPEVLSIGTFALQAQLITMPLWGLITMSNMFTQSIGYGVRATIVAASRQGICLIPVLLVLPRIMGITGLQIAQPVADVLSFVLSILIVQSILKEMKQMKDRE